MPLDIKNELFLLKSLQDIDLEIHMIDTALREIPIKIAEVRREYDAQASSFESKKVEKEALETKRRMEELEIESQVAHLKDREVKLYAIKTNKEYQAAIKEIGDGKEANKIREDALMAVMTKIDSLGKEITQLSLGLDDKKVAVDEKEKEFRAEEALLNEERETKLKLSREAEAKVDVKVLRQYHFVKKRIADAIAGVSCGVCQSCNMNIMPQMYRELQKWIKIMTCPNCNRIMYYVEPPAREESGCDDEAKKV